MKLDIVANGIKYYIFYCPGCKHSHVYHVCEDGSDKLWVFNNDIEKPTFRPSLLNRKSVSEVCHLFVTNGQIQFLNDCTHAFAGKTVDLIENCTEKDNK